MLVLIAKIHIISESGHNDKYLPLFLVHCFNKIVKYCCDYKTVEIKLGKDFSYIIY